MKQVKSIFDQMVSITDIKQCTDFKTAVDMLKDMFGWTYDDLANALGYSKMHTYNVCAGRYDLNLRFARRLAELSKIDTVFWVTLYLNSYD